MTVTAPTRSTSQAGAQDYPPARITAEPALAAIAVGAVAVTFLWWHDTYSHPRPR